MRKLIIIWLVLFLPLLLFGGGMQAHDDKAQVYRGPTFDSTDTYNLHVDSVIVTKDTTYVHCTYCGLRASWASISDSTYLEDIVTHDRFPILKSLGLPYSPQKRDYIDGEIFNVVFLFPSINETKRFNLIENKKQKWFNIYNIDLGCCTDTVLGVKDLAQLLHKKDSLILDKDTMNLVHTMDQIYKVTSSLYGYKSYSYVDCVVNGMSIYEEYKLWERAISQIDLMRSLLFDSKYEMNLSEYYRTDYRLLLKKAHYYHKLNQIQDEASILHHCLSIINEIDSIDRDYEDYKEILSQLVDCYSELNDKDQAIKYNKECIKVCEDQGKYKNYSLYLESVLKYYSTLKQYNEAVTFSETELAILPDSIDNKNRAFLLYSLFDNHNRLGNTDKAFYYGEQTCQLLRDQTDNDKMILYFHTLSTLGIYYFGYHPNYDKAEYCLKEALNVSTKCGVSDFSTMSHIYHILSLLYGKRGNYNVAIEMENENGKICEHYLDNVSYTEHLFSMGCLFFNQYKYNEAINYFQRSLDMYKQIQSTRVGELYRLLVKSYMEMQDTTEAKKIANESICYYNSYFEHSSNHEKDLHSLALIYYLIKDYKNAELLYMSLLDHMQKNIIINYGLMNDKEKQLKSHKFNEYLFTYGTIISLGKKNHEQISKLYNFILFSKSLFLNSDHHKENFEITWKDIQNELSINDIAIEFFETYPEDGDRTYNALLIDKIHDFPQMINLFKFKDYEDFVIKLKEQKFEEISDSLEINDYIWFPIFEKCEEEVNRIFFSPGGFLNYSNVEYTLIDYDVSVYRLSSTSQIAKIQEKSNIEKAILYGGLDYNNNSEMKLLSKKEKRENHLYRGWFDRSGFDFLDNAYEEVIAIDYLFNYMGKLSSLFVGEEGTEESFKKLSGKKVDLIHLATHGKYIPPDEVNENMVRDRWKFIESIENEENPYLEDYNLTHSFLAMSGGNNLLLCDSIPEGMDDGILTAQEISKLDLGGVDLVVLSACQSAFGDFGKDGNVYGLQRGFKKAGANTIIMSLFTVDDEATKLFMIEFYKNLLYGETKMQSFKNAQEYLRNVENGKYRESKYWAPFIMLDGLN